MPTLEQQSQRLALALKSAKCGLWDWNIVEDKVYFDPNYFLISGYEPDEFPHHFDEWIKRVHPDDLASVERSTQQYLAGEIKNYTVEFRFKTKKSNWMWVLGQGEISERDKDGNPVRFTGLNIDINEKKLAEEVNKGLNTELLISQQIVASVTDLMSFIDNNYIYRSVNPAYCRYHDKRTEDIVGYSIAELHGEETFRTLIKPELDKAFSGETIRYEAWFEYAGAGERYVIVEYSPARDERNEILGVVVSIRDITARKKAEKALQDSEAKNDSILRSAPIGIGQVTNRQINFTNENFARMLGYSVQELIGKNSRIVYPSDEEFERVGQYKYEEIKKKGTGSIETTLQKKDGTLVDVFLSSTPVDLNDLSKGVTFTALDITERKQTEKALQNAAHEWRLIMDEFDDAIYLLDNDRRLLRANSAFYKAIKTAPEEAVGRHIVELIHPQGEEEPCSVCQAQEEKRDVVLIMEADDENNPAGRPIEIKVKIVRDAAGASTGILMNLHDLTQTRLAEQTLWESEQKFRLLADYTYDWEYWLNPEGDYIYVSPSCERITGYTADEFMLNPKLLLDLVNRDYAEEVHQHYADENNLNTPLYSIEFPITTKAGEERWLEHHCSPVFDEQGNFAGRRGNNRDITEQHQALQTIIKQKETAQQYLDIAGVMFGAINKQGEITLMNKKGYQILGYPEGELLGRNWIEVCLPASSQAEIKEVFNQQMTGDFKPLEFYENAVLTSTGEERTIAFHNTLLNDEHGISGVLFSGEDITDRKQAEVQRFELKAQLAQKHKIEALGLMAGGMAHNFNNNLSIILGGIELSRIKLPGNSEVISLLDNAKIAVLRSRDLIQNILSYSRQGALNKEPSQLALVVEETLKLLRSTIPATVKINYQPDAACHDLTILADSTQIQEALINLCNNAIQAMDEQGEIAVSLTSCTLQPEDIPAQYQCSPGAYLQLSVQDSGCGMSDEIVENIFDPFFTTKAVDQGTGMGLATLHGMVVRHGGLIKVQSAPGQGSIFELYFPLSDTAQVESSTANTNVPRGTGKILLLDDDELLAQLGETMLSELGYQVTTMNNSTETLKLFQANSDYFDLVITDQTMPDMTGQELIQEMRKIRPDMAAILCTGYSSKVDENIAKKLKINAFLMKPLELAKLAQTVRKVLDGVEIE